MTSQKLKIVKSDEVIIKKKDYQDYKDITTVASNHCKLVRCKTCDRIIAYGYACIHCGDSEQ